jgi:hypothetical protein
LRVSQKTIREILGGAEQFGWKNCDDEERRGELSDYSASDRPREAFPEKRGAVEQEEDVPGPDPKAERTVTLYEENMQSCANESTGRTYRAAVYRAGPSM